MWRENASTPCGYNMCWMSTNYDHLLCGLCQLRWYWVSMPVERTLQCWPSPRLPFDFPAKPVRMLHWRTPSSIGSTPSREVTRNLSVPTRLCTDSSNDEIEHSVDPIRIGRMFVHHGDSVDEPEHVDNMDIRSDLSCALGAEQEDFSRLVHRFVRVIDFVPGTCLAAMMAAPMLLPRAAKSIWRRSQLIRASKGTGTLASASARPFNSLVSSRNTASRRSWRVGKWRYSVPMATPADLATSSRTMSAPRSETATRATFNRLA